MKIIGIGDLVLDYYFEDGMFKGVCGGMTSFNVISHLAKYFETYAYAVCGNDLDGEIAIKSLEDVGVNTNYIKKENTNTRCFYINIDKKENKFSSKKSCPMCGEKKWYEATKLSNKVPKNLLSKESVLVLDTINKINLEIVDKFRKKEAKIILDMGQVGNFKYLTKEEILDKLLNRFDLVQLNERVALFLLKKFKYGSYNELNNIFNSKIVIITHGKDGATMLYNNKEKRYLLKKVAIEVDPSGAGDAFLSVAIKKYIQNDFKVSEGILDELFDEASNLSAETVQRLGARGALINLYDKKRKEEKCICGLDLERKKSKRNIKKTVVNLVNLKNRVNNALETEAYKKLSYEIKDIEGPVAFIGTGGSKTPAIFSSKVLNTIKGITTISLNPRELVYRNNNDIKGIFAFSYSGVSNDILYALKQNTAIKQYIVTKGDESKILSKYDKAQIISYGKKMLIQ